MSINTYNTRCSKLINTSGTCSFHPRVISCIVSLDIRDIYCNYVPPISSPLISTVLQTTLLKLAVNKEGNYVQNFIQLHSVFITATTNEFLLNEIISTCMYGKYFLGCCTNKVRNYGRDVLKRATLLNDTKRTTN